MKQFIRIEQLDSHQLFDLIEYSHKLYKKEVAEFTRKFILGLIFFQPSTRTRIGFQASVYRLGGYAIEFNSTRSADRMPLSETVEDSIRSISEYVDIFCIRHPEEIIIDKFCSWTVKPIINAGNGEDQHPSQTIADLLTIYETFGKLNNLKIGIIGDLKHMRAAHSTIIGLSMFDNDLRLISPLELKLPEKYKFYVNKNKGMVEETTEMDIDDLDILYLTGFSPNTNLRSFTEVELEKYHITKEKLSRLKCHAKILCPLPRFDEISRDVDQTSHAVYFEQSHLALYARMAIINKMLNLS